MKSAALIAVVVLSLLCEKSLAKGYGLYSSHDDDDSSEENDDFEITFITTDCRCHTGRHYNTCARSNTSTYNVSCPFSNKFLQCSNATCTNQTCPAKQIWNHTLNSCAACPADKHLRADGNFCVCNNGTTFNFTIDNLLHHSTPCIPCPKDAILEPDRCFCSNTSVFQHESYSCRPCPPGATVRHNRCRCGLNAANQTLFFNRQKFTCDLCPGEFQNFTEHRRQRQECRCTGTNQIFNRRNVTCVACPQESVPNQQGTRCRCTARGQEFNPTTQQCQVECDLDRVPSADGKTCVPAAPPV